MTRPTAEQWAAASAEVVAELGPGVVEYDGSMPCGGCGHRADEHTWGRRDGNPCELDDCDCAAWEPAE